MGPGPYPAISLAQTRQLAADARSLARTGKDPIEIREVQKAFSKQKEARGIKWHHVDKRRQGRNASCG
jgi:hypothetical protein